MFTRSVASRLRLTLAAPREESSTVWLCGYRSSTTSQSDLKLTARQPGSTGVALDYGLDISSVACGTSKVTQVRLYKQTRGVVSRGPA